MKIVLPFVVNFAEKVEISRRSFLLYKQICFHFSEVEILGFYKMVMFQGKFLVFQLLKLESVAYTCQLKMVSNTMTILLFVR